MTTEIGIPYATVTPSGNRICPVCGEVISEEIELGTGEMMTNNYGYHYLEEHVEWATDHEEDE